MALILCWYFIVYGGALLGLGFKIARRAKKQRALTLLESPL